LIELKDKPDYLIGGNYIEVFEDSTSLLSLHDIISGSITFKPVDGYFSTTKNTKASYWIRFRIGKPENDDLKWLLEILDSRQEEIVLYEPLADGSYKISQSGYKLDFYERDYTHKNFVFEINPAKSGDNFYYLKFKAGVITSMLFKIRTTKDFTLYAINEYYLLGLYYGVLIMMAIYSLFIFLTIKEKVYLLYFLYVLSWMYNSLITDNIGFQFFWPSGPEVSKFGFYFARLLLLCAFVFYSLAFLNIHHGFNNYRKYIIYSLILYTVYYPLQIFADIPLLNNVFFLLPFVLIYYVSLRSLLNGFKPARYFILGNSIILLGILTTILRDNGFLEWLLKYDTYSIIAVYSTNIAMILEIIVLSFAMADRLRFFKTEKDKAQQQLIEQLNENQKLSDKVNRELEVKVKERTAQLEEKTMQLVDANKKLAEQAEKINQINAILDLDNWNLKKKIIEEKQSRIVFKGISFDEFVQVYPNEASCFSFIEELKWEKGFTCMKCGNTKYGKGINPFSRRCTKCRYDETVTTHTIFHKCKFPINKALYIVAMINRHGENVSFTELARELQLRNATCWSFSQKVLKNRNTNKYTSLSDEEKLKYLILEK
jgi:hypothetical protein